MKEKLKTFKVWVHVDSGYEIKVKAKDEDEALGLARDMELPDKEYTKQLLDNAQTGEANVVS